jgi:pectin methylesterase-like acyl-CoA thioesterase
MIGTVDRLLLPTVALRLPPMPTDPHSATTVDRLLLPTVALRLLPMPTDPHSAMTVDRLRLPTVALRLLPWHLKKTITIEMRVDKNGIPFTTVATIETTTEERFSRTLALRQLLQWMKTMSTETKGNAEWNRIVSSKTIAVMTIVVVAVDATEEETMTVEAAVDATEEETMTVEAAVAVVDDMAEETMIVEATAPVDALVEQERTMVAAMEAAATSRTVLPVNTRAVLVVVGSMICSSPRLLLSLTIF